MKTPQNKTARKRINKLAALHELSLRICSTPSVDALISAGIGQIVNVIHPDVVFFYLRQNDKLLLKNSWQGSGEKSSISPEVKDVGVCLCGLAASEKKAVYSPDIHKDTLCTLSECKEAGLKSFAALPLFRKSEVIGVLSLASFTERDFKEESVFLEILTSTISIAMANALDNSFLLEAKQSLEAIIQASPLPIFTLDREGKVRLWNHAAEKTFGWTSEEALGQLNPIVPEDKLNEFHDLFNRLLAGEDFGSIELRRHRKDGMLLDIILYTSQIRDESGSVVGIMSIIEDVTERKQSEEASKRYAYNLEKLLELSQSLISTEDLRVLCRSVLQTTADLLKVDYSTVMLLSDDKVRLTIVDCIGFPESMIGHFSLLEGQGLSTHVLNKKKPDKVLDFLAETRFEVPPVVHEKNIRSAVCVPMMVESEIFGVLISHTNDQRDFSPEEISLYQNIGNQAAIAIKNAMHLEALKESEERLGAIFENASEGILLVDLKTKKFCFANSRVCQMLGYSPAEIKNLGVGDIHPEEDLPDILEQFEKQAKGEIALTENIPVKRKDRTVFYADINSSSVTFGGRNYLAGFFTDITKRRKAEESLQESELRFKSLLQTAADAVIISDSYGNIILWNAGAEAIFGYAENEVKGRPVTMLMPEKHKNDHLNGMERLLATGRSTYLGRRLDFHGLRKDGTEFPLELSVNAWRAGKVTYFLGIIRDTSDRQRIKEALEESQARLQMIINSEPHCVKLISKDGGLLEMNPAGLALIGADSIEQVKGRSLYTVIAADCREAFENHVTEIFKGNSGTLEFEVIGLKGTHRWLSTHSVPFRNSQGVITALLGITRDITDQKRLEDQLRQAQKMEAVGQLAGGVAHDFNNILSAIVGYAHLTLMKMREDDPLTNNLHQILQAAERATTLTHSLLAFSRKQPLTLQPVDLNELVRNFHKFMLRLLPENIELKISYAEENLQTIVDRGQIEQVLMNLITNARDAMPDGGRITVKTELAEIDNQTLQMHGLERPGNYALIIITDTGYGIDRDTMEKIFEPFFTTKEVGRGTGLGLAMAYGIIKKHNGGITVDSEPGKNTSFRIYLPIQRTAVKVSGEKEKSQPARGGSETILVAEDDESLRKLSKTILKHYGYKVIEAVDGEDAVEKIILNKDTVQLVILDGIMPRKNGKEAYDEIKAAAPDIRVIFMSGYSEDIFKSKEVTEKGLICMLKPVTPDDLVKKVREVLDK